MHYFNLTINTLASLSFLASFLLPGKFSFWPEFHQATAAIFFSLVLLVKISKKNKLYFDSFSKILSIIIITIFIHSYFFPQPYKSYQLIGFLYLSCALLVNIVAINTNKNEMFELIAFSAIAASLISVTLQIYQSTGWWMNFPEIINAFDRDSGNRVYANIGQPNLLGTLYVVSIILAIISNTKKILSTPVMLIAIYIIATGIYLTDSRTALLSLVIASLAYFIQEIKKPTLRSILIPSVILIIQIERMLFKKIFDMQMRGADTENLSSGRIALWKMTCQAISESWLWGYGFNRTGLGNFSSVDAEGSLRNVLSSQAHNIFLDFIAWFGLPVGMTLTVLVLLYFYGYFKKSLFGAKKDITTIACIPILVHSLLEYPLYYSNFLLLFAVLVGLQENNEGFSFVQAWKIKIFASFVSVFAYLTFLEMKFLEESLLNQKLFFNRIYKAAPQNPSGIYIADIPADHIRGMLQRDDKNLTKEFIFSLETFSTYYIVPRNFYLINTYYNDQKNNEKALFWREKSKKLLPASYENHSLEKN